MAIFEGAGVALVTPFKENGSVNYEVLESLIEEQIAGGTDCIVAMGNHRRVRDNIRGGAHPGDPFRMRSRKRKDSGRCWNRIQLYADSG